MIEDAHPPDLSKRLSVERRFIHVSVQQLWELWTKKDLLESWFGPEGFDVRVLSMDMRPGGDIRYTLTAVGPEQISLAQHAGLPLSTECRLRVTELIKPHRLGFEMLIDSFPEVSPYEVSTAVELTPTIDGSVLRVISDEMHDRKVSERVMYCHASQLRKLTAICAMLVHEQR